jgi:hypothetical protein
MMAAMQDLDAFVNLSPTALADVLERDRWAACQSSSISYLQVHARRRSQYVRDAVEHERTSPGDIRPLFERPLVEPDVPYARGLVIARGDDAGAVGLNAALTTASRCSRGLLALRGWTLLTWSLDRQIQA